MTLSPKSPLRILCTAAALLAAASAPAPAQDVRAGDVVVSAPWARATAPAAAAGSVYMDISNTGTSPDRLVAASSPAARQVELHTHSMDGGVMRMRQVPAIDIAPGEAVSLAPGGLHIMLVGLAGPLVQGTAFPLTLSFENGGTVEVEVPVGGPGATAHPDAAGSPGTPGGGNPDVRQGGHHGGRHDGHGPVPGGHGG